MSCVKHVVTFAMLAMLSAPSLAFAQTNSSESVGNATGGGDAAAASTSLTTEMGNLSIDNAMTGVSYVQFPSRPTKYIKMTVEGDPQYHSILIGIAANLKAFWNRMGRGNIRVYSRTGRIGRGGRIGPNNKVIEYIPGAASVVPVTGNAVSARHESGHEFTLQHANVRYWSSQTVISYSANEKDPFDPMTVTPGAPSLNAPHLHYLGWFRAHEEAYVTYGMTYNIAVINNGNSDISTLKALYYQVPNSSRQYWFSYVLTGGSGLGGLPGMPGTAIAIHSNIGNGDTTLFEGLLGVANNGQTHVRTGLVFEISQPTTAQVSVQVSLDRKWVLEGN